MPPLRVSTARPLFAGLLLVLAATSAKDVQAEEPQNAWAFKDHDRIVLVGDTLIERDQRYGYLETVLTIENPSLDLTFRNLGWSGDTVRGLSRAGFDPPDAGFKALKEQVLAAKPTVLVVGYGMADSFDGPAGLSRFVEGYNAFLDAVAPAKARLVLLSPLPHEALPAPLPDPTAHNRDLALYAEAVGKIAAERKATFVDLFKAIEAQRSHSAANAIPDTDNGIHLTALGSWRLANSPGASGPDAGSPYRIKNLKPSETGVNFVSDDSRLPTPPEPGPTRSSAENLRRLQITNLTPGRYMLKIDGRPVLAKSAEAWAAGVVVPPGPELDQVEQLRKTINEKNLLFFYRWRPQNITYLFGFRKHEQGRNAIEIPQFDPLVDAKEKEIARLRKPVAHTYELIRENEVSQ
ncbi:MAG: SGNH/GDSL hydrolase family protein [Paludisphaera borealis]|uniref:SGNH/GDSL hydrolase family protein n=1 Tax=Paludisphaera borealis TaxID=1387353 RepID=UPI0028431326|nr:SGNH/GDSL hydrolase family protein [Paludisphaera borealis]MDR3618786.1 SGNH/GDSL hydrolase family protein [Paludisphaera borealis]